MKIIGFAPDKQKIVFYNNGLEPEIDPHQWEISVGDLAIDVSVTPNKQWICTEVTTHKYFWKERRFFDPSSSLSFEKIITQSDIDAQYNIYINYTDMHISDNDIPLNVNLVDLNNNEIFIPDNIYWDNTNDRLQINVKSYHDEIIPSMQWKLRVD